MHSYYAHMCNIYLSMLILLFSHLLLYLTVRVFTKHCISVHPILLNCVACGFICVWRSLF